MKPIHVAVIGVGSFGRHHVRHLAGHPLVHRVSVVDRDRKRAAQIAAEHGAQVAPSAIGADAAIVAVPTEAHAAVALPLLEAGVPVLIEKPIAASDAEACALIEAAEASNTLLQVGHIERFSPVMQALRSRVGKASRIDARRHNPPRRTRIAADVVLDLMIHDIDLVLGFARAPLTAVDAFANDRAGHDAAAARLTFADGLVADISASRQAAQVERTFTVKNGVATWRGDLANLSLTELRDGTSVVHAVEPHDNLGQEIDNFVQAVAGNNAPMVGGEAGASALAVANRIRSAVQASLKISA